MLQHYALSSYALTCALLTLALRRPSEEDGQGGAEGDNDLNNASGLSLRSL